MMRNCKKKSSKSGDITWQRYTKINLDNNKTSQCNCCDITSMEYHFGRDTQAHCHVPQKLSCALRGGCYFRKWKYEYKGVIRSCHVPSKVDATSESGSTNIKESLDSFDRKNMTMMGANPIQLELHVVIAEGVLACRWWCEACYRLHLRSPEHGKELERGWFQICPITCERVWKIINAHWEF